MPHLLDAQQLWLKNVLTHLSEICAHRLDAKRTFYEWVFSLFLYMALHAAAAAYKLLNSLVFL